MSDRQSDIRFLCPVRSCSHAFKSKSTWTRHLHSVHPLVKFQPEGAELGTALPRIPVFPTHGRRDIQVSPPTSPADGHGSEYTNNDFEMGDFALPLAEATEEFIGMFRWPSFHSMV
jgi:hypothetical protein